MQSKDRRSGEHGVIFTSVTSAGTPSSEWNQTLDRKLYLVGSSAQSVITSRRFDTTVGIVSEIAIYKGNLFEERDRRSASVHHEARKQGFSIPEVEIAILLREKFSDQQMTEAGLDRIIVMHQPVKRYANSSVTFFLALSTLGEGRSLVAVPNYTNSIWPPRTGFAFLVSQSLFKISPLGP